MFPGLSNTSEPQRSGAEKARRVTLVEDPDPLSDIETGFRFEKGVEVVFIL